MRVEPKGIELVVEAGETIMRAAERLGFQWPTVCGGQATCRACSIEVLEGEAALAPMERIESGAIEQLPRRPTANTVRLACQTMIEDPDSRVVVFKRGVRRSA